MLITFEGLDGCGKTTQAELLCGALRTQGHAVRMTREPGGCPIAEDIRRIVLGNKEKGMGDVTEALLFAAARAQHVRDVIMPALSDGLIVVCDRFIDSSVAYQGGGRGLGVERVRGINAPAVDGCVPDLTFYLSVEPALSLARRARASSLDRIEHEQLSFFERVSAAYDMLACQEPERIITLDGALAPDELAERVLRVTLDRLRGGKA